MSCAGVRGIRAEFAIVRLGCKRRLLRQAGKLYSSTHGLRREETSAAGAEDSIGARSRAGGVLVGNDTARLPPKPSAVAALATSASSGPIRRAASSPEWALSPPRRPSVRPVTSADAAAMTANAHAGDEIPPPLPEQLRSVMRLVAHPVVVCTATATTDVMSQGSMAFNAVAAAMEETSNTNTTSATGAAVADYGPKHHLYHQHHSGHLSSTPTPPQNKGAPRHLLLARAMTASSLTSLSLSPTPCVTFNVRTPSRTLDAVAASGRFNIHVLAATPDGVRLAARFALENSDNHRVGHDDDDHDDADDVDHYVFSSVGDTSVDERRNCRDDEHDGRGGNGDGDEILPPPPPELRGPGVLYVLRCRLLRGEGDGGTGLVRVLGDCVIVLGEVLGISDGGVGRPERERKLLTDRSEMEGDERGSSEDGEDSSSEPLGRFGLVYADRTYRRLGNILERSGKVG